MKYCCLDLVLGLLEGDANDGRLCWRARNHFLTREQAELKDGFKWESYLDCVV
jgi:hypothetical protein